MSQGKFSSPRPHRDEERQIEQAFRQVTGQEPIPQPSELDLQGELKIPNTVQQAHQPPSAAPRQAPAQPPSAKLHGGQFDLIPDDLGAFFEENTPSPEEVPDTSEPDFVDNLMDFFRKAVSYCEKNQKIVMAVACAGALLLILGFIGIFFAGSRSDDSGLILDNVLIADINVGGMTKEEAISAINLAMGDTYSSQDMVIDLSGTELRLSPRDTKAKLDIKAVVDAAYDYGRTGTKSEQEKALADSRTEAHIIGLLPYLGLDTDYIEKVLTAYAEDAGSTLTQTKYGLEGEEPELSADKFNEKAPTQTLVITMGTPGIGFDVEDVFNQVLDAYSLHIFLVTVADIESVKEPDPVDLDAIYEEFYIAPVNATVNLQTFQTQPGSYGYEFDKLEARKLIDNADYGEVVRIPMEYIPPEILSDNSFFKDTLGSHQTRITGNNDRTKNLELACKAIHDTVLEPGESLSFSNALSGVSGFKKAPEDTGRSEISKGGVSQVASTLYYAALLSDLEISSRSNHGYVPSFIEQGLDATSSLQIKNSTGFPIRIEAKVSGGYVIVKIIGTEERSHYVVLDCSIANTYTPVTEYEDFEYDNDEGYEDGDIIEEGVTGYLIKSYKVKYSRDSGKELSRDFVANSQYPAENKVVARVEPEPTTEPTTEATEEPTEEPTEKPTEAPKPTEPAPTEPVQTQPPATETAPPETLPQPTPTEPAPTEAPKQPPAEEVAPPAATDLPISGEAEPVTVTEPNAVKEAIPEQQSAGPAETQVVFEELAEPTAA